MLRLLRLRLRDVCTLPVTTLSFSALHSASQPSRQPNRRRGRGCDRRDAPAQRDTHNAYVSTSVDGLHLQFPSLLLPSPNFLSPLSWLLSLPVLAFVLASFDSLFISPFFSFVIVALLPRLHLYPLWFYLMVPVSRPFLLGLQVFHGF